MIVARMAATVSLNSGREPMPSAHVFRHWHRSGRVSLSCGSGGDIQAQKRILDGSDGIHSDGTEQVGEARAHSIDPTMSTAQSANGRLRDRRSKDSISIQIYATRPTPCPRRSSLTVISALMLNVSVVDRWHRSVAAF